MEVKGEGTVREFDLRFFENLPGKIVECLKENEDTNVYLYELFHIMQNGNKKVHGYIVTDTAHNIIEMYVASNSKSTNITKAIANELFGDDSKDKLEFNGS